jgi:Polyketide cyclase / dehydrase and lipid transport
MDTHPLWRRLQGALDREEGEAGEGPAPAAAAAAVPAPRVDVATEVDAPAETVWAVLTSSGGPPWRPPAMVQVTVVSERPPVWSVVVDAGPWRLPHRMEVARERPPRSLTLVISGRLRAVVRFDLTPLPGGGTRLRQRLWFELEGSPVEAALGGAIVEGLARRFAPSQLRALKGAAERPPPGA